MKGKRREEKEQKTFKNEIKTFKKPAWLWKHDLNLTFAPRFLTQLEGCMLLLLRSHQFYSVCDDFIYLLTLFYSIQIHVVHVVVFKCAL